MTNIFEDDKTTLSKYTFLACRPIIEGDSPTMTGCPNSRFTNAVQLRGGRCGQPSECLTEYNFAYGDDDKFVAEWDLVYKDFEALRSHGKPMWYTGSNCVFQLKDSDRLSTAIATHTKMQKLLDRPSTSTRISEIRLYEQATFAAFQPANLSREADGLSGLFKWNENTTHFLVKLGYNDEPEIVARIFDVWEEAEAVKFFFDLKTLGLPLWYDGAEILTQVTSKTNMLKAIKKSL